MLLDVEEFYEPLFALFDRAVGEGFVRPQHRALASRACTVSEVFDLLAAPPAPPLPKWISRDET